MSNYPPGVTGGEDQIVAPVDTPETDGLAASALYLSMMAAWHDVTLAEWDGRPIAECVGLYDTYLTALGAYIKHRREHAPRQPKREAVAAQYCADCDRVTYQRRIRGEWFCTEEPAPTSN